ncbi:cupin domain-containing protein [Roseomonas sp. HF4]|uniref:cupin domain-containing protein n=1 Tax=Roseomonas sp. HF4 TaxID=2562313 RepID=UPI001F1175F4|nr:cupin domain-containing protein [Roseomonas sp. HF4]
MTSPGIVVLDRAGRIGFVTDVAEAMLRLGDGVSVQSGRLAGRWGGPRLDEAVGAALAATPTDRLAPLRAVALRRRDGLPLIATISPLATTATGPVGALVLLHDPETAPRPGTDLLRQAFGLTVAEAAVAVGLLQGATLREIAEQRGVSVNTVRTLMSRLMDKTGTHRQADLIRLLMPLALTEAVQAGFAAGFAMGTAASGLPGWPLRPLDLFRGDLAQASRQEARVSHLEFAPGRTTSLHRHADLHEIVYVLDGSQHGEWGADQRRISGSGELLHFGPGVMHRGRNAAAGTTRLLLTRIFRAGAARTAARHASA